MDNEQNSASRRHWMSVLARATHVEITCLLAGTDLPAHVRIRGPEAGLVMTRGQAGGTGAAFNFGEMTVTRCTIRDSAGRIGHAYVRGLDMKLAELAAVLDAALQDPQRCAELQRVVIEPLAVAQNSARELTVRRAAATRVDFSALATMR